MLRPFAVGNSGWVWGGWLGCGDRGGDVKYDQACGALRRAFCGAIWFGVVVLAQALGGGGMVDGGDDVDGFGPFAGGSGV